MRFHANAPPRRPGAGMGEVLAPEASRATGGEQSPHTLLAATAISVPDFCRFGSNIHLSTKNIELSCNVKLDLLELES